MQGVTASHGILFRSRTMPFLHQVLQRGKAWQKITFNILSLIGLIGYTFFAVLLSVVLFIVGSAAASLHTPRKGPNLLFFPDVFAWIGGVFDRIFRWILRHILSFLRLWNPNQELEHYGDVPCSVALSPLDKIVPNPVTFYFSFPTIALTAFVLVYALVDQPPQVAQTPQASSPAQVEQATPAPTTSPGVTEGEGKAAAKGNPLQPGIYSKGASSYIIIEEKEGRFCYMGVSDNGTAISSVLEKQYKPGYHLLHGFLNMALVQQDDATLLWVAEEGTTTYNREYFEEDGETKFEDLPPALQECLTSTERYSTFLEGMQ